MKKEIALFGLLNCLQWAMAQPDVYPDFIGCRHAHQSIGLRAKPTTEREESALLNSNRRSDSIDILNYEIHLDISNYSAKYIEGHTKITFKTKLDDIEWIQLDLRALLIDSIVYNGNKIRYNRKDSIVTAFFGEKLSAGTEAFVVVYYKGNPVTDPVWGGFYFADNYIYNLGIGLSSTPPNFGKVWFPCFDNFVERSSYDYYITTAADKRAYCVGTFISEKIESNGKITRHYRMRDEIPTYLSSIAASNYQQFSYIHEGTYRDIPVELIARSPEMAKMRTQFGKLGKAIDAFEYWFGPYQFERVGYVATTVGAMEHPTNVAYPVGLIAGGTLDQNERLFAHELGHHWWGNVTTLDDARDMWIKEGPSEYAAHLFVEYAYGKDDFIKTVRNNLSFILFNAHLPNNDGQFLALSPMPYTRTYGTHTYRKGAAMMHNMRTYMGDELFRKTVSLMFDSLKGKSINAYQFRDFLTRHSGIDMTNFFNDFIFNKGYCDFFVEDFTVRHEGGKKYLDASIVQKEYYADHLYNEVPLPISVYGKDFSRIEITVVVSGEKTEVSILLPDHFEPAFIVLNEHQQLNLAHLQGSKKIYKTGAIDIGFTGLSSLNATSIADSAYVNVNHHLVAPSGRQNKAFNINKVSGKHFWEVNVLSNAPVGITCQLTYAANDSFQLESDILFISEDSLILVYRKNINEPWQEHSHYSKLIVNPNDKKGFIRITNLIPGQYALANGYSARVGIDDIAPHAVEISPNPTADVLNWKISADGRYRADIINQHGATVMTRMYDAFDNCQWEISPLPTGSYYLVFTDEKGKWIAGATFVKI